MSDHQLLITNELGGLAAALRLGKRAYSNTYATAKNRITLRNYGKGLAEVGWSFVGFVWDGDGMLAGWACSWK